MPQTSIRQFAASVALGALIFAGPVFAPPALATAETPVEDAAKVQVDSFSGAFLAARTADADYDTQSAIRFYRKALEFDPGNLEVRERLMVALFVSGRFEEALDLTRTLADDEAIEQVRNLALAVEAMREGDYAKGAAFIDTSSTNPIDRLLNTLMVAWMKAGDGKGDEALKMVEALDGPPWYPVFTQFHAGAMAELMGRTTLARQYYQNSVTDKTTGAAAPDTYIRTVMALAALEARQGNERAALDTLSAGEDFATNYAPLAALRQKIAAGEKPAPDISDANDGGAAVLFTLGGALNREGAEETVSLYLQFSRALDPDNAATLVMLGGLQEALDKPEAAIEFFRQVPADSPMRRISELQLGLALADLGREEEARRHLKELIAAGPSDMRSYLAYGSVLSSAKDYEEMADNYQKAVAAAGPAPSASDWNLFFQLGIAYERLKQWPKAEAAFKRALQLQPKQPQVMNYLGYSWVDMNMNLKEGMDLIREAVELRPNDGYIVDSLGWAHYKLGQFEDAVRELERAVELRPADATINDHLGDAYWRVGRKVEAGFQWNRALSNEPEPELKVEIEKKLKDGLPPLDGDVPAAGTPDSVPAPERKARDAGRKKTEADIPRLPSGDGLALEPRTAAGGRG